MAMRVTSKMMQGNSLSNLNTNKALQEKLNTQLSTLKKITRPSDDPVIAIRALRLNSTLAKVDQYYEKNSKDAKAWLKLTDDSINTVTDIITSMRTYMVQGANGEYKAEDRSAIAQNMRQLMEEIYSIGNADYEGRSIFTGYRTGDSLSFQKDSIEKYAITEQLSNTNFDTTTFVSTGDVSEINKGNFMDKDTTEYDVQTYDIHRIRLAYSDLVEADATGSNVSISYGSDWAISKNVDTAPVMNIGGANVKFVSEGDGTNSLYVENAGGDYEAINITNGRDAIIPGTTPPVTMTNTIDANGIGTLTFSNGTMDEITMQYQQDVNTGVLTFDDQYYTDIAITNTFANNTDEAYMAAVNNPDAVVYIAETGEVLFGDDKYVELAALSAQSELRFSYEKSNWQDGDLNPIHYFSCTDEKGVIYNSPKLIDQTSTAAQQVISYDMGNNQKLRVNTTADEVFTHDMGRDVEEFEALIAQILEIEDVLSTVDTMVESGEYHDDELTKLEEEQRALNTSKTYLNSKLQKLCESYQTKFDDYLNSAKLALTEVGSRESRQKLIDNRLDGQQTTFETLVSDNEDADLSELAVQLSSVELTYEAALSSIGYLMKTTLLDFI